MSRYLPQAPRAMFRVISFEPAEDEAEVESLVGDFNDFREACMAAARGAFTPQTHIFIYDESGRKVGHLGAES